VKHQPHFLNSFFNPASIAVVGASRNPLKISHNLLTNLINLKFPGKVYPINPGVPEILGLKAYSNLQAVEDEIDLVVCGVPATSALEVIKDCVEKGVKNVVVVAGGFSEAGQGGRKLQGEIARLLKENGIRAIGPNSLSPINSNNNLVIGFVPHEKLTQGGASFIFQSGLYEPRLNWLLLNFHLGINKLIDLGNKMDVNEVEALEYLGNDPETKVIAMHLESVEGDGRAFFQLLKEITRRKPVVVLKSARTPAAAKAASSHTGVMAKVNDAIFNAALRQAGAVHAQTLEEFFDFTKAFECFTPLELKRNQIVIATFPGGEGVITTDVCQVHGLSMADVSPETYDKVQTVAPPWAVNPNPFDLGVSTQFHDHRRVYQVLMDAMTEDKNRTGNRIAGWGI
jgi:acetyltransferase